MVFRSKNIATWIAVIVAYSLLVILFYFKNKEFTFSDIKFFSSVLLILLLVNYWSYKRSWIKIENQNLTTSTDSFINNKTIPIHSIKEIDRLPTNIYKTWGSSIVFRYINEKGEKDKIWLMESYYKTETLKQVIIELKKINQNIKINKQYLELINGDHDYELEEFKRIVAIENNPSQEKNSKK